MLSAATFVMGTTLWQSHSSSVILVICPMALVHDVLPCSTCSVPRLSLLFHQDSPDSSWLILKPSSSGHPDLWIPGTSSPDLWLEASEQNTRPFKVSQGGCKHMWSTAVAVCTPSWCPAFLVSGVTAHLLGLSPPPKSFSWDSIKKSPHFYSRVSFRDHPSFL